MKLIELLKEELSVYEPEELVEAAKDTLTLLVDRTNKFLNLAGNVGKFDPVMVERFEIMKSQLLGSTVDHPSFKDHQPGLFDKITHSIDNIKNVAKSSVGQESDWMALNSNLGTLVYWADTLLSVANKAKFISRTLAQTFSTQCHELKDQLEEWFKTTRMYGTSTEEEDEDYYQ